MTKAKAQKLWPLLQAWCEGKQLQIRDYAGHWCDSDFDYTEFSCDFSVYRIKPTLKLRPWKQKEVPPILWVKPKGDYDDQYLIVKTSYDGLWFCAGQFVSYQTLFNCYTDIDNNPCGILEDQP